MLVWHESAWARFALVLGSLRFLEQIRIRPFMPIFLNMNTKILVVIMRTIGAAMHTKMGCIAQN